MTGLLICLGIASSTVVSLLAMSMQYKKISRQLRALELAILQLREQGKADPHEALTQRLSLLQKTRFSPDLSRGIK